MLADFQNHIKKEFSHLRDRQFLLAVSGGVDSVVMAHLFSETKLDFAIAHCNFRLRGIESDKDEEFTRKLAKKLDKKFHVTHFDTIGYINKNKVSVQMAARQLRYRWFEQIMNKYGYKTLVTAHHADDNFETFLIHLSRGSGLEGLTGMPEKTDVISRPLLAFSRMQIEDYAKSKKFKWREDESNLDTKYLRNKIRHELVPQLKELHPSFSSNFETTLNHLKGSARLVENHINVLKNELFLEKNGLTRIQIKKIQSLDPLEPYIYQLFKDYGFTAWGDIHDLLTAMSGKEIRSKTHRLVKDREDLLLHQLESFDLSEIYRVHEHTKHLEYPIKLEISEVSNFEKTTDPNILYIDKKTLKYPMTVRKWRAGDYFYPLGMKGKKKVSKFFKDEKVDLISKEKQWMLCSDDKIVWILGKRADDRFKVDQNTETILKINLIDAQ